MQPTISATVTSIQDGVYNTTVQIRTLTQLPDSCLFASANLAQILITVGLAPTYAISSCDEQSLTALPAGQGWLYTLNVSLVSLAPGGTSNQGPTGARGPAGPTGQAGPQGVTGPAGTPGGPTGPQGATGVEGPTGPMGPAGPPGPTGAIGATGVQGIPGVTGPFGGPPGDTGATGPVGPYRALRRWPMHRA